jgi:hypothetical protein
VNELVIKVGSALNSKVYFLYKISELYFSEWVNELYFITFVPGLINLVSTKAHKTALQVHCRH